MQLTNKSGLPEIVLRAMNKSAAAYSKAGARLSVTQLIGPPQISVLKSKHYKEMEEDAADRFWSLLGSAVHHILEEGAEHETVEQRLHAVVNGWEISGAIDVQEEGPTGTCITDYKVTSAFKIQKGDYSDWEKQQNIYAWLVKNNTGRTVTSVRICAIIRDWQKSKLATERDYPKAPMVIINLPLWPLEYTQEFLIGRVRKHQEAVLADKLKLPLPECTMEEKWATATKYALMKPGGARAVKLFDDEEEANNAAKGTMYVQHRPGKQTRCEGDYCGVARWCEQRKKEHGQSLRGNGGPEGEGVQGIDDPSEWFRPVPIDNPVGE